MTDTATTPATNQYAYAPDRRYDGTSVRELVQVLRGERTRHSDFVAHASDLRFEAGKLVVEGLDPHHIPERIDADGVTPAQTIDVNGSYAPTRVFLEGASDRLKVPGGYNDRTYRLEQELYDFTMNTWLRRQANEGNPAYLVRTLVDPDGDADNRGISRAFLTNAYGIVDDLDALAAVLTGIREAGVKTDITRCNLTGSHMYVRVRADEVHALAPAALLDNYRSPFSGRSGTELPRVFAGLTIKNSEVGRGLLTVAPTIEFEVCTNGMTIERDAYQRQHLGERLEAGQIPMSIKTERKALELITAKTEDAVRKFLSADFVTKVLDEITTKASTQAGGSKDASKAIIKKVSTRLKYSEAEMDTILSHFEHVGDRTAGGVMQAVTSAAQMQDADRRYVMEASALRALDLAVQFA